MSKKSKIPAKAGVSKAPTVNCMGLLVYCRMNECQALRLMIMFRPIIFIIFRSDYCTVDGAEIVPYKVTIAFPLAATIDGAVVSSIIFHRYMDWYRKGD